MSEVNSAAFKIINQQFKLGLQKLEEKYPEVCRGWTPLSKYVHLSPDFGISMSYSDDMNDVLQSLLGELHDKVRNQSNLFNSN